MKQSSLKFIAIAAFISLACTTKVSEWVLLNAPADKYLLVYYHKGTLPEPAMLQNSELEKSTRNANMLFRQIPKADIQNPYYALFYKNRLFARYDDSRSMAGMTDSPLRKKIAGELMEGQLCVMLYLTTGNSSKDLKSLEVIRKTLSASPFGNIITLLELNRKNAEENHFVNLLLNMEEDLKTIDEPMLFGVFGRFRVLEPLLAKGISEENIRLMIDFFTADCSCVIKDDLPGISILCEEKWQDPQPARVNLILDENPQLMHH
jgi:hypothetical protein